jgi:hypothetical protein
MYGVPRDRDYRQIFHEDDDEAASIRIPRRAAVIAIIYTATTTIALLACLLALLLRGGREAAAGRRRDGGLLPPLSTEPTSPPVARGPHPAAAAPARRSESPFSATASRFLVLTDLHLEPHYNASAPNADLHVCRDDEHITACVETDWERLSASAYSSSASSAFSLGRYLCDPPYAFLSAALTSGAAALSASSLSPSFLLVPGDLVAHFSPCPLTHYATYDAVLGLLASAFPSIPIIVAIGNADLYPNAYLPPPPPSSPSSSHAAAFTLSSCPAPFSSLLSALLRHGVIDAKDDANIATFCQGGYYARVLPKQRLRVVVLNTQLWSADYADTALSSSHPSASFSTRSQQWRDNTTRQPLSLTPSLLSFSFSPSSYPSNTEPLPSLPCDHRRRLPDPYHQFRFLRQQISLASLSSPAQRIVLMGHKPPGAKAGSAGWCAQYEAELQSIISEWPNVVSALMFGDYSEDRVKLMDAQPAADDDGDEDEQTVSSSGISSTVEQQLKVVHINPGLTMRKNVNPAARLYELDPRSGSIVNYHQYYIDLQQQQLTAASGNSSSGSGSVVWWYQYDAVVHYGMQSYGSEGWLAVARRMMDGERGLLHRYIAAVNVWKAGLGDGVGYVCDMLALGLEENTECRRTGKVPRLERGRDGKDGQRPTHDSRTAAGEQVVGNNRT